MPTLKYRDENGNIVNLIQGIKPNEIAVTTDGSEPEGNSWKLWIDQANDPDIGELMLGTLVNQIDDTASDTTYPSTLAVKNYVDGRRERIYRH